jgi:hypothetical protein
VPVGGGRYSPTSATTVAKSFAKTIVVKEGRPKAKELVSNSLSEGSYPWYF